MKTFKSFIGPVNELETIKLKPKKEQEIVDKTYMAQVKDPGDLEDVGPEEVGPEGVKPGSGKRPADRLDNKQPFGESESHQSKTTMKHVSKPTAGEKKAAKDIKPGIAGYRDRVAMLKSAQARGALKEDGTEIEEADFTKQQTKMAHTIGKEFEKKGVGDKYKGGPYAVATAMVKDKPEAAQKAYATIKAKMKEDADIELLTNLYDNLNEENQQTFLNQLEEDAELLLVFAKSITEE
jgi:hypothetical protein